MKEYIKLLILLISTLAYSQKTIFNNDTILKITSELIVENNKSLLKNIESKLYNNQQKKVDSLNREILYYKIKEDYYVAALSEQSNKYIFITSGLLAILALISFGVFKIEIQKINNKTNKKLTKQTVIFERFRDDFKNLESNSFVTQANLYASIGIHFKNEHNLALSLTYHIDSALFHIKYLNSKYTDKDESLELEEYEAVLSNIIISNEIIEEIITDGNLKPEIKKRSEDYLKSIDDIYSLGNEDIKNKISELRVRLTNYMEQT